MSELKDKNKITRYKTPRTKSQRNTTDLRKSRNLGMTHGPQKKTTSRSSGWSKTPQSLRSKRDFRSHKCPPAFTFRCQPSEGKKMVDWLTKMRQVKKRIWALAKEQALNIIIETVDRLRLKPVQTTTGCRPRITGPRAHCFKTQPPRFSQSEGSAPWSCWDLVDTGIQTSLHPSSMSIHVHRKKHKKEKLACGGFDIIFLV